MKIGVLVLAVLCLGAGTCYAAMYELKQDNVACVIINSTLIVSMDYVTKLNKTARVSWTLSKPGPNSISGLCAKKSPGNSWSEIVINASNTIVGFRFVSQPNGYVSLANVSLTVDIVNGSRFKNPMSPGRVRLVAKPSLSLSSNIECFACHSKIGLNMKAENKTVTSIGQLQLTGGTVIQAFNLTKGKFSDKVTQCPQDANSTTTSTMAPITTSTPPSEPPEITLTVNSRITGQPCLRLRSRLRMQVDYLRPGMVAIATVFLREDATATGDCGDADSANGTEPVHQTMTVTFFDDWQLTFSLARSGSVYSLVGLQLVYSVSNRDVFPGASDAGKQLFASSNATFFSDVSSNGYYDCHRVNFSMKGPAIPYTHQDTGIELIGEQFTMQAFRNVAKNSTDAFVGDRKDCLQDRVDNIVPIVVGASLAALVVIVLLAYLIGRRRAATRDGYQSV